MIDFWVLCSRSSLPIALIFLFFSDLETKSLTENEGGKVFEV